jgi:hypothetical protein
MLPQVIKERLTCTFTSTGYKNDKGMEKKIFWPYDHKFFSHTSKFPRTNPLNIISFQTKSEGPVGTDCKISTPNSISNSQTLHRNLASNISEKYLLSKYKLYHVMEGNKPISTFGKSVMNSNTSYLRTK